MILERATELEEQPFSSSKERWDWHMTNMSMTDPFVHNILLLMTRKEDYTIPTMAVGIVKGKLHIYYNPDFINELSDPELRYVLTHEVFHVSLHHTTERQSTDKKQKKKHNVAADLAVNSLISENNRRKMPTGKNKGCLPKDYDLPVKLSLDQYLALLPDMPGVDGKHGCFDDHDRWTEKEAEIVRETVRSMVERMSKSDKYWGNTSADIRDIIQAAQKPKVDWTDRLHVSFGDILSKERRYTKRKPNPRYGWPFVGTVKEYTGRVLVEADVSGSVNRKQLGQFISEVNYLRDYVPVDFCMFDAHITQAPVEFNGEIEYEIVGGGGTSFQPGMDLAEKEGYRNVVVLTDGYAPVPTQPRGVDQIIWVLIDEGRNSPISKSCPWGEKIYITSDDGYQINKGS